MIWSIEFLEEAEKDMKKLDHSAQIQVLKGIRKVSQNPLSVREGGYGKPLGNKSGTNLTNLMKIKFRFMNSENKDLATHDLQICSV